MKKFNLKELLKFILVFFVFLILALIIDLLVFNFNILFLDNDERNVLEINNYNDEVINDNRIITVDCDGQYVNKMKVIYTSLEDVEVAISYIEDDYYGNAKENEITDIFDNEVKEQVISYNNNISEIKFIFDGNSDITIDSISIDNTLKINYFRVIYMFSIMIAIYIVYKFYSGGADDKKIHRYFLILGLLVGGTIIIIQPAATYYSWDDQIHFLHTYELIGGDFQWKIGEFSMIDSTPVGRNSINTLEEQENQKEYLNSNGIGSYESYGVRFITYHKICYLPSALGFYLGKLLNLPFVVCFKLGKFMNLLSYLLMFSLAIKITKNGKKLLTIIGFIPTSIFLASQYSYDAAVTGGLVLGMVCAFNWILDKDSKVDFNSMAIFIFAMLYGCFPKEIYAPLLLVFLLIPKERFKDRKQEIYLKVGVVIICLFLLLTFVLPTVTNTIAADARGGNTSVSGQIKVILDNPIGYVKVLRDTMGANLFSSLIGKVSLFNYAYIGKAGNNLYYCFLSLILFVLFTEKVKNNFDFKNKVILLFGVLGIMLLIWTALYLSYTPVGLNTINGVQYRYFIPLLFPLLFIFKFINIEYDISSRFYNVVVIGIPVLLILFSLFDLFILKYCM